MTISLLVLLWMCCAASSLAFATLLHEYDRSDSFHLLQIVMMALVFGPICFVLQFIGFLVSWHHKFNPVIWRRKP
jgi:ABC-type polysaccharide/polyol phosphate export permease